MHTGLDICICVIYGDKCLFCFSRFPFQMESLFKLSGRALTNSKHSNILTLKLFIAFLQTNFVPLNQFTQYHSISHPPFQYVYACFTFWILHLKSPTIMYFLDILKNTRYTELYTFFLGCLASSKYDYERINGLNLAPFYQSMDNVTENPIVLSTDSSTTEIYLIDQCTDWKRFQIRKIEYYTFGFPGRPSFSSTFSTEMRTLHVFISQLSHKPKTITVRFSKEAMRDMELNLDFDVRRYGVLSINKGINNFDPQYYNPVIKFFGNNTDTARYFLEQKKLKWIKKESD